MQALVDFLVQWQLNSARVSWLYIAINGELNGGVLFLVCTPWIRQDLKSEVPAYKVNRSTNSRGTNQSRNI